MTWDGLYRMVRRHPLACAGLLLLPILFIPAVDLTVSGWFYDPVGKTFPARGQAFPEWIRLDMPRILFTLLAIVVATWAAGLWVGERIFAIGHRLVAYLSLSLALGPGLVVNVILKEHWGRPRPSTLIQFGGANTYVPPFVISDQCTSNCSFSSGHGALGFWVVAVAFLAPPAWRRGAIGAALLFGCAVGWVRIAQGGHFLSDVIVSAIITVSMTFGLYKLLIQPATPRVTEK